MVAELSSPRDREIVKRFYLDEEDKQTICDDLRLSSLQFNQVIARARQRMKQQMEAKGLVPGFLFRAMSCCDNFLAAVSGDTRQCLRAQELKFGLSRRHIWAPYCTTARQRIRGERQ
jgi:hypothetical protein